jgi:hypothetical protein
MVQTLPRGSGGSISISSGAGGSWPPGPEGTFGGWDLVVCWLSGPKVDSGIWDLEAPWSSGPEGTSESQNPIWGLGLKVGSRSWDLKAS